MPASTGLFAQRFIRSATARLLRLLLMLAAATLITPSYAAQPTLAELSLEIRCVKVLDRQWTDLFGDHDLDSFPNANELDGARAAAKAALAQCEPDKSVFRDQSVMTLIGDGDVVVYVGAAQYEKANQAAAKAGMTLRLRLNGMDQGADTALIGIERPAAATSAATAAAAAPVAGAAAPATGAEAPVKPEPLVALRFHLRRSAETRALWTSLYNAVGIKGSAPLRVGLGWSSFADAVTPDHVSELRVRVADLASTVTATLLIVLLFISVAWVLFRTDAFRDAATPAWWPVAKTLQRRVSAEMAAAVKIVWKGGPELARAGVLDGFEPGVVYQSSRKAQYEAAAKLALAGEALQGSDVPDAVIGLALRTDQWKTVRPSFSLGRIQMGLWFVFVVATGLFLWVVYGQLPFLPPSMLGMLTLSAATAGASAASDSNAGGRPWLPSRGLWNDLVTGFNDKQQIHRFQSVVVNVLLLAVGITQVIGDLVFPSFDNSWLGFLGLSGVALTAGKEITESDVATPKQTDSAADKSALSRAQNAPVNDIPGGPVVG